MRFAYGLITLSLICSPAMAQVTVQPPNPGAAWNAERNARQSYGDARDEMRDARQDEHQARRDAASGDWSGAIQEERRAQDDRHDARQDLNQARRDQWQAERNSDWTVRVR